MRPMTDSSVTPAPPASCTARSTIRQVASLMKTLAREDSSVPFKPPITWAATCHSSARQATSSISLSAMSCWAMPRDPSGAPKRAPPPPRPRQGAVVRAPGRAEPAHAVRQPGRHQPDLGVREAAAGFAEHRVIAHERLAQPHVAVPADGARVDGPHPVPDLPAGIAGVDEEHARALWCARALRLGHDDREPGAIRAGDEVLVAVQQPAASHLAGRGDQC